MLITPKESGQTGGAPAKGFVNLRSPIFWRITAGVFASILLIETALLIFSWYSERDRKLSRLDDSVNAITSLIDRTDPVPQLNKLIEHKSADSNYQIIGYVYNSPTGLQYVGGQSATLEKDVSAALPTLYSSEHKTYSIYKSTTVPGAGDDELLLKIDAAWISVYMQRYIWRILGMIVLISLFVTGACLIFIHPLLIKPLQRLDRLLVDAEQEGIHSTNAEKKDLLRRDEIGSVFRSFNHWRNELITSEKDRAYISERFEQFANMGADCFWEVDASNTITYISGDTRRLLSVSSNEMIGRSYQAVLTELAARSPTGDQLINALRKEGLWEGEIKSASSGEPSCSVRVAAIPVTDAAENIIGYRGTVVDTTEETALKATLHYRATHDELTGLCNRRELADRIGNHIDAYETTGSIFTILTLDIDRFKAVNDNCGHVAGDLLLKSLAAKMLAEVKDTHTVARIGGDEFSILLTDADTQTAQEIAEKIRTSIEQYQFVWEGKSFSVSVSIGLAEVSNELSTLESIIFASDSCCISAKESGKNQIRSYSPDDNTVALERNEALWISRIHQGLVDDHFRLFRQSITRIDKKEEEHFEILIRLQDDSGGYWPPNLFLPVAERNDLMPKIDAWVVTKALDWLAYQTLPNDKAYCMNINLSAASLADQNFQRFLLDKAEQNLELTKHVCLEITETAAMVNPEETIALLKSLRRLGCQIALDDFGTGFSSLSQIRSLPLDYIKIDGAFIQEIQSNELDQALVRSIAEIAQVLEIQTVAEFVDSEEALQKLKQLKIDYAQGFLISKPEALDYSAVINAESKAA